MSSSEVCKAATASAKDSHKYVFILTFFMCNGKDSSLHFHFLFLDAFYRRRGSIVALKIFLSLLCVLLNLILIVFNVFQTMMMI